MLRVHDGLMRDHGTEPARHLVELVVIHVRREATNVDIGGVGGVVQRVGNDWGNRRVAGGDGAGKRRSIKDKHLNGLSNLLDAVVDHSGIAHNGWDRINRHREGCGRGVRGSRGRPRVAPMIQTRNAMVVGIVATAVIAMVVMIVVVVVSRYG